MSVKNNLYIYLSDIAFQDINTNINININKHEHKVKVPIFHDNGTLRL